MIQSHLLNNWTAYVDWSEDERKCRWNKSYDCFVNLSYERCPFPANNVQLLSNNKQTFYTRLNNNTGTYTWHTCVNNIKVYTLSLHSKYHIVIFYQDQGWISHSLKQVLYICLTNFWKLNRYLEFTNESTKRTVVFVKTSFHFVILILFETKYSRLFVIYACILSRHTWVFGSEPGVFKDGLISLIA